MDQQPSPQPPDPRISRRSFLAATASVAGMLASFQADVAGALTAPTIDEDYLAAFVRILAGHPENAIAKGDASPFTGRVRTMAVGDRDAAKRLSGGLSLVRDAAPDLPNLGDKAARKALVDLAWPWPAGDIDGRRIDLDKHFADNDAAVKAALEKAGMPPRYGIDGGFPDKPIVDCVTPTLDPDALRLKSPKRPAYVGVGVVLAACQSVRPDRPIRIPTTI